MLLLSPILSVPMLYGQHGMEMIRPTRYTDEPGLLDLM